MLFPIDYVDINPNAGRTLLLLHGWPSLWASWKYQIEEFRVCDALCSRILASYAFCRETTV